MSDVRCPYWILIDYLINKQNKRGITKSADSENETNTVKPRCIYSVHIQNKWNWDAWLIIAGQPLSHSAQCFCLSSINIANLFICFCCFLGTSSNGNRTDFFFFFGFIPIHCKWIINITFLTQSLIIRLFMEIHRRFKLSQYIFIFYLIIGWRMRIILFYFWTMTKLYWDCSGSGKSRS